MRKPVNASAQRLSALAHQAAERDLMCNSQQTPEISLALQKREQIRRSFGECKTLPMVAFMMRASSRPSRRQFIVATNALGSTLGLREVRRRPKPLPSNPITPLSDGHPAVPSGTSPAQRLGRRTEGALQLCSRSALLHGVWSTSAECGTCAEFAHAEMMTD